MNKRDRRRCECAACRDGMGAMDKWEQDQMAKHGYFVHVVPDDPTTGTGFNAHTHGLDTGFAHPDLQVVLPLAPEVAAHILHIVADRVKQGEKFKAGDRWDLTQNHQVEFVDAVECGRPVLRVILPDDVGNLERGKIEEPWRAQYGDLPDCD